MPIDRARVKVRARFHRSGSVLQGTLRGECAGFEVVLSLSTPAPEEAVRRVVRLAHASCYTESSLRDPVEFAVAHEVNGAPLSL